MSRYEVHYRATMTAPTVVTAFADPQAALDHAAQYMTRPWFAADIHDTETGERLTYAELNYRLKTGRRFGPLVPQPDGSIL